MMFYSILNSKNNTNDLKIYPNFKSLNCTNKIPVFCYTENLRINKKNSSNNLWGKHNADLFNVACIFEIWNKKRFSDVNFEIYAKIFTFESLNKVDFHNSRQLLSKGWGCLNVRNVFLKCYFNPTLNIPRYKKSSTSKKKNILTLYFSTFWIDKNCRFWTFFC